MRRARYLSLIGGVCLSFYDWYCDLPPASPQTWGEQTDVPESADWYNSTFIMMWGSNVPQTRTPDAHFITEARYRGTKVVSVFPDYAEGAKFGDLWLHPKQGTDAALGAGDGPRDPQGIHLAGNSDYFIDYCRASPTCRCWCGSCRTATATCPSASCARPTSTALGEANNPDWKTVMIDEQRRIRRAGRLGRVPLGPAGRRRQGQMEPARRDVEGRGAGAAAVVHGGA
jgi:nitrate reductase alpha subunit